MTTRPISVLEVAEGLPVELGENLNLYEINSPLARLNLGDIAGRLSELLGDIPLGQLGIAPCFLELALKATIGRTVKSVFRHWLPLLDNQAYFCTLVAPIIGAECERKYESKL